MGRVGLGRAVQWCGRYRVAGIAAAVPGAVWEERREAARSQGTGPAGGGLGCEPGRHWGGCRGRRMTEAVLDGRMREAGRKDEQCGVPL